MKQCSWQEPDDYCFNNVEGRTEYCARHNRLMRKAEETAAKDAQKLADKLLKDKELKPRKSIKKVSDKQRNQNEEYKRVSDKFKEENPICAVRVNEYCSGKTESVHHKRGRGKYLLEVSTFLPCCISCHSYIEAHPEEAYEKGWSVKRISITKFEILPYDRSDFTHPLKETI